MLFPPPNKPYTGGIMRYENLNVKNLHVEKIIPVQSIGASSASVTPEIWSDFPILSMMAQPGIGIAAFDDFANMNVTGFPYSIQGANGTCLTVAATPYGVIQLLAPGTDNDECFLTWNNALTGLIKADATKDWAFEARVKLSQIAAEQGVFVGLAEESAVGADFMTDDTMALKVVDAIGFQIVHATADAAQWQTIIQLNGGARVAVDSTAVLGSTSYMKLGMRSKSGTVTFYVDGAPLADTVASTATNFPLDQVMLPTFATKTGKAAANSLYVDWWMAAQLR